MLEVGHIFNARWTRLRCQHMWDVIGDRGYRAQVVRQQLEIEGTGVGRDRMYWIRYRCLSSQKELQCLR